MSEADHLLRISSFWPKTANDHHATRLICTTLNLSISYDLSSRNIPYDLLFSI
jgi:hypothetical protein